MKDRRLAVMSYESKAITLLANACEPPSTHIEFIFNQKNCHIFSKDPIRLNNNGTFDGMGGRVEIWQNGQWGTICDISINVNFTRRSNFARVVCRQLHLPM